MIFWIVSCKAKPGKRISFHACAANKNPQMKSSPDGVNPSPQPSKLDKGSKAAISFLENKDDFRLFFIYWSEFPVPDPGSQYF